MCMSSISGNLDCQSVIFVTECSEEHPCEGLGVHAHFQNFGMAFLTLFRVATGDNWNGIMKASVDIYYSAWYISDHIP